MIALRYDVPGKITLVDIPIPKPDTHEILIKVAFSGICGTDIHIIRGEASAAKHIILGHEFSGIIAGVGTQVKNIAIGTRVSIDPNNYCGACSYCRRDAVHFCEHLRPNGITYDGGWAEYCIVPADQVYPLNNQVSLEWGALVEPLSCIVHGWDRIQPLDSSIDILIMGSGLIGLLWGLLLRYHGFNNIAFSEPNKGRISISHVLGFNAVQPDKIDAISDGFDLIIDCTGNGSALEEATYRARSLGKILYFGIVPQGQKISIEPHLIFRKELSLLGSVINPFTYRRAIELIEKIQTLLANLGVSFFTLADYEKAIAQAQESTVNKVMFSFI